MDILTCFKIIPDLDQIPEADWASGVDSGSFDFRGIKNEIDPIAEGALELALRFKDAAAGRTSQGRALSAAGSGHYSEKAGAVKGLASGAADRDNDSEKTGLIKVSLDAVTVVPAGDNKPSERVLRTLTALGYDHTALIADAPITPFSPDVTSKVLAAYCRSRGLPDLILIGAVSADGGTGMTGPLLAAELGLPCLTEVTDIRPCGPDRTSGVPPRIRVTYLRTGMQITETVNTPLVLTIGDIPGALLRVPTLRQRKAAADAAPEAAACAALCPDLEPSHIRAKGVDLIDQSRSGLLIEGKNAAEKAAALYEDYLKTEVGK